MIRTILAEMQRGTTSVRSLSRRLKVEESALRGMLDRMVRKGLVRELHPQCRPRGCRGCPYHGKCHESPVVGYEVVTPPPAP